MTRGTGHRDDTGDHRYYSQIPHLLDDSELTAYACRLYLHYKRVCSPNWVCYESVRTTATKCGLSATTVIRARNELADSGWIVVELDGTGRSHTVRVTLIDRWQENMDRYSKCTPGERFPEECPPESDNVPLVESKRTPGGIKEEPIKKNCEEDPSLLERGTRKDIDPDFLTEMTKAFPAVDVQREYAKFHDWRKAKGRRFKDDRAAFRNWLRKAEEFAAERKQSGQARAGRGAVRTAADLDDWERY